MSNLSNVMYLRLDTASMLDLDDPFLPSLFQDLMCSNLNSGQDLLTHLSKSTLSFVDVFLLQWDSAHQTGGLQCGSLFLIVALHISGEKRVLKGIESSFLRYLF